MAATTSKGKKKENGGPHLFTGMKKRGGQGPSAPSRARGIKRAAAKKKRIPLLCARPGGERMSARPIKKREKKNRHLDGGKGRTILKRTQKKATPTISSRKGGGGKGLLFSRAGEGEKGKDGLICALIPQRGGATISGEAISLPLKGRKGNPSGKRMRSSLYKKRRKKGEVYSYPSTRGGGRHRPSVRKGKKKMSITQGGGHSSS